MSRALAGPLLTLAAVGCSARSARSASQPPEHSAPAEPRSPARAVAAPVTASALPAGKPAQQVSAGAGSQGAAPGAAPVPEAPSYPPRVDPYAEVGEWVERQGISGRDAELTPICQQALGRPVPMWGGCICRSVITVGKSKQEALFCEYATEHEMSQIVYHALLLGVRSKRARVIWSIPVAMGPMDPPEPSASYYIRLHADLEPEGMAIRVVEAPGSRCEKPSEFHDSPESHTTEWRAVARRKQAVCRGRGEYVWQNDGFRRRAPKQPARRVHGGSSGP